MAVAVVTVAAVVVAAAATVAAVVVVAATAVATAEPQRHTSRTNPTRATPVARFSFCGYFMFASRRGTAFFASGGAFASAA